MPSHAASRIAINLDRGIREKGWTNRQVGDAIGKTEHQVWRWRHAKNTPSLETLMALAELLFDGNVAEFHADGSEAAA